MKIILIIIGTLGFLAIFNEGRFFPVVNLVGLAVMYVAVQVYPWVEKRKRRALIGNDYYDKSKMMRRCI